METKKMRLTASGAEEVQARIKRLEEKIQYYEKSLVRAIEMFGIHDEQYFDRLQRKMYREQELIALKKLLSTSEIIIDGDEAGTTVDLGDKVKLTNHMICYQFQIVSPLEANPTIGKISAESPVGSSIIGKEIGSVVMVTLPKGEIELKIEAIE